MWLNTRGIDGSYLSQLFAGRRPLSALGPSVYREVAAYLGLPVVVCALMGGWLAPSDFLVRRDSLELSLKSALETISRSPAAMEAAVSLSLLANLEESIQLLLVMLYEQAMDVRLLPERVSRASLKEVNTTWVPFEIRSNTSR
jgi:hypothetical protein